MRSCAVVTSFAVVVIGRASLNLPPGSNPTAVLASSTLGLFVVALGGNQSLYVHKVTLTDGLTD